MKGKEAQALYYCDIGMWLWHYLSAIIKLKADVWCGCEGWHKAEGVCLETEVAVLILLTHLKSHFTPTGLSFLIY